MDLDKKYITQLKNIYAKEVKKYREKKEEPLPKPIPKITEKKPLRVTPKKVSHFELREYQKECVDNVISNWKKGLPAVISAQTGAGKTYMGVKAAQLWDAELVIVIGPKASLTKWREVLLTVFPSDKIEVYTYDIWRTCKVLKEDNSYTVKRVTKKGKETVTNYYPSDYWVNTISKKKVVFIIDEFHKLQKPTQQTLTISANVNAVVLGKNLSRILTLSYTPCDNILNIPNHMYLFGITRSKNLLEYDRIQKTYDTSGLSHVIDYAEKITGKTLGREKRECRHLEFSSGRGTQRQANTLAGEIFLEHIRPHLVFSCVPDFLKKPELKPEYTNYFCRVTEKTQLEISAILNFQSRSETFQSSFEYKNGQKNNMAILTFVQSALERLKTDIYIQVAREILSTIEGSKVPIMVMYLDSMNRILEELKEYNPVKICGSMTTAQRDISINKFQEHNDTCRVLVATLQTGGESIDLHDTSEGGRFPRYILIPPTYSTKPMVQATGRVFRDGVTSKPVIRIIYTTSMNAVDGDKNGDTLSVPEIKCDYLAFTENDELNIEHRFYDAVRNKTSTIKKYHAEGQESVLPCNYESVITEKIYRTSLDTQFEEEIPKYNRDYFSMLEEDINKAREVLYKYGILSSPNDTNDTLIKKRYKMWIIKNHPDRGGDEEVCKSVMSSYEKLFPDN